MVGVVLAVPLGTAELLIEYPAPPAAGLGTDTLTPILIQLTVQLLIGSYFLFLSRVKHLK
jgi:hypothetical protein